MLCTKRIAQRLGRHSRHTPSRCLHSVPTLTLTSPESKGIPGIYTPAGYKVAWTDYQTHVIEALNRVSAETDYESMPLVKTIAQTGRQPENASIYNYAAQAFSNHFFFDALKPVTVTEPATGTETTGTNTEIDQQATGEVEARITLDAATYQLSRLVTSIETSFKSIDAFKAHTTAVASAMLGSGWIWLVLDGAQQLRILSTYNAGTPFDFARLQSADPNTGLVPMKAAGEENAHALYQSMKRSYSLTPIACLSLWEHSYLIDYGVTGKEKYVANWFEAVDWTKVQDRLDNAKRDDRTAQMNAFS